MGTVIGLSDILRTRQAAMQSFVGSGLHAPSGFTPRDRADLNAWAMDGRRVEICSSDAGVFATLHEEGRSWASWGVERQARGILLWNCVTHADVDRFSTMAEALAAIASAGEYDFVQNVIQFAADHSRSAHCRIC